MIIYSRIMLETLLEQEEGIQQTMHPTLESITDDESRLFVRYQNGDLDALSELVRSCHVAACAYGAVFTHDHHLAEDAVQNVWAEITEDRLHFDPTKPFRGWFFSRVKYASLHGLRSQKYGKLFIQNMSPDAPLAREISTPDPSVQYIENQEVQFCVESLPPDQREVIQGYMTGRKISEMATEEGVRDRTIRARRERGLTAMKALLYR